MRNGLKICSPTGSPAIAVTGSGSQTATIIGQGSVEFTTVATVSLNNVFSADYDNYLITIRYTGSINNVELFARLRSGTDNSTTNSYVYQLVHATGTTIAGLRTTSNQTRFGNSGNERINGISIYVYGPFLAQPTAFRSISAYGLSGAAIVEYASTHNQSVSYNGITLYPSTGTFGGVVSVYGLVD